MRQEDEPLDESHEEESTVGRNFTNLDNVNLIVGNDPVSSSGNEIWSQVASPTMPVRYKR